MNWTHAVILGTLDSDPIERTTRAGNLVVNLVVAVRSKRYTSKLDVSCSGIVGKIVMDFFKKGDPVFIEGKLQQNRWKGQDGLMKGRMVVFATVIKYQGSRPTDREYPDNFPDDLEDAGNETENGSENG